MRILLVENDATAARTLERLLIKANFNVTRAETGGEGLELAMLRDYDLILQDLGLPDMGGMDVLEQLGVVRKGTPVMVLSRMDDPQLKLQSFHLGADDYIIKPFLGDELVARVKAIIRRSRGLGHPTIHTGRMVVDIQACVVEVDGKPVNLTKKEYQILELLSLHKGTIVTKQSILHHLYGGKSAPQIKIIDVFVCKLRKKLADALGGENYIETVWGRGYVLADAPDCPSTEAFRTVAHV